jgi:hypothetical protein
MNDAHGETICCKFDIALVNALEFTGVTSLEQLSVVEFSGE